MAKESSDSYEIYLRCLFHAIRRGDLEGLKTIFEQAENPTFALRCHDGANSSPASSRDTPLILAVRDEVNLELVKFLLENGANPNAVSCRFKHYSRRSDDNKYYDAFHIQTDSAPSIALKKGDMKLLQLLKEYKADFSKVLDNNNEPAIFYCIQKKLWDSTYFLLSEYKDVDCLNGKKQTPLQVLLENETLSNEQLEFAKKLLSKGASYDYTDVFGNTPLHNAIIKENVQHMKLLLENGADIMAWNIFEEKPVQFAMMCDGDGEIFELIKKYYSKVGKDITDEYEVLVEDLDLSHLLDVDEWVFALDQYVKYTFKNKEEFDESVGDGSLGKICQKMHDMAITFPEPSQEPFIVASYSVNLNELKFEGVLPFKANWKPHSLKMVCRKPPMSFEVKLEFDASDTSFTMAQSHLLAQDLTWKLGFAAICDQPPAARPYDKWGGLQLYRINGKKTDDQKLSSLPDLILGEDWKRNQQLIADIEELEDGFALLGEDAG